jgi:hypothetical protein
MSLPVCRQHAAMIAQSLVDYGVLQFLNQGVQSLAYTIRTVLESISDRTWVTIGAVALLLAVLWSRRSPRF